MISTPSKATPLTSEQAFAKAVEYEIKYKDMLLLGDRAAAHAFHMNMQGYLEDAMELEKQEKEKTTCAE